MTQVFLLGSGTLVNLTWPDPGDWNPVNTVECLGGAGSGGTGITDQGSGGGGGGGAYAVGTNITPTFPTTYTVIKNHTGPYYTCFNTSTYNALATGPNVVSAKQGTSGVRGTGGGGLGGNSFHPSGFAGGKGGDGSSVGFGDRGGGGGGSAGPQGAGSVGGAGGTSGSGGTGGAANNNTVAGGASGTIGNSGTQWDATHGCGSGGGGSPWSAGAGAGGKYGGGGGGGGDNDAAPQSGGLQGEGLIILTYTPFSAVTMLRPDTDDFNASFGGTGSWVNQADSTTNIFASIDEATTDDVDYIQSPAFATNNSSGLSIFRLRLSDAAPGKTLVEPIKIRYRFRKTGTGDKALNVNLKQGSTIIASWTHTGAGITTSFQTATQTLTSLQASQITNYNDLFIEFMDDEV